MKKGRKRFAPVDRPQFIRKLRELGFEVASQQDRMDALSGVVVALAEEVDELEAEVVLIGGLRAEVNALRERMEIQEQRQPAAFGG